MFSRLIRLLAPPAPVEELPDIFGIPKPVKAAKPKPDALPVLIDPETNKWAFTMPGKQSGQSDLTAKDVDVLAARKLTNADFARQAKPVWAIGTPARDAAKQLGRSESMIEKYFAAFSFAANQTKD